LRKEATGTEISVCVEIKRWKYGHLDSSSEAGLKISILDDLNICELFQLEDYSSLDVMVGEALAKIREWKEE
jgi:hypothetical protein